MIPRAHITAWRKHAPWPDNSHVEQDLVLSRALIELYRHPPIAEQVVFRGGTALHKLFFDPPGRYSEDLDLVQRDAGPIGPLIDELRAVLDPWLGTPKWKSGHGCFTLYYRFDTSFSPVVRMRAKIEINTREHLTAIGFAQQSFAVASPWFSGEADITTYELDELLGTKLRALYQRKKGRDLFDLWLGLDHADVDPSRVVRTFERYMKFGGTPVMRAQFEENMDNKMGDRTFLGDLPPLLRTGVQYSPEAAWERVHRELVSRLPGAPWRGKSKA